METSPIIADFSEYPVVRVTIRGELSLETIRAHFETMERKTSEHSGPFVIIDVALGKFIKGEVRTEIGKLTDRFVEKFEGRYLGSIVIIKNTLTRMMVSGALLLVRNKSRVKLVESPHRAQALAQQWLEQALVSKEV
ncbi:MAG TPA: hypothetical protein DCE41_35815 [Cytophagales bacterium]|nr:hypothetical protein [Cytophagales bacterium]HAA24095.1 hypothetical protein [Cytophagales bacterium]HAP58315.1 hypothetical protein [Cytophagales bacterium]